ncbi:hypothetical protein GTA51_19660 [Desulfovibrio aerotolerans]|uniref:Uncharacterized protein n=1 Tax=Solidesulfovibrio aerotolerans TaxID=295255 RepID=A0A7C9N7N5_9BACT|nr:hypothetical protein [Solidesulfovibrio aerotolerans]MYL85315.1 hypothetical protein [Solidesulfovibrio aerotolerans]
MSENVVKAKTTKIEILHNNGETTFRVKTGRGSAILSAMLSLPAFIFIMLFAVTRKGSDDTTGVTIIFIVNTAIFLWACTHWTHFVNITVKPSGLVDEKGKFFVFKDISSVLAESNKIVIKYGSEEIEFLGGIHYDDAETIVECIKRVGRMNR